MEATDDLLRLENQLCFALVTAARNVVAIYRPILEPLGLTHPQYLVMLALWEHSPRALGELAGDLAMEPATLSPLVKRLEVQGLVDFLGERLVHALAPECLLTAQEQARVAALARVAAERALTYMDLKPGTALRDVAAAAGVDRRAPGRSDSRFSRVSTWSSQRTSASAVKMRFSRTSSQARSRLSPAARRAASPASPAS